MASKSIEVINCDIEVENGECSDKNKTDTFKWTHYKKIDNKLNYIKCVYCPKEYSIKTSSYSLKYHFDKNHLNPKNEIKKYLINKSENTIIKKPFNEYLIDFIVCGKEQII